ncbi:MAG: hypothetical protein WAU11_09685 [Ignavibacteriaceae bacterium]
MKKTFIIISIFLIFYTNAYANAGTPLIWAGLFHLLFGNFFIGGIETFLLIKKERIYKIAYVLIIIICANYASMYVGWVLSSAVDNYFVEDSFNPSNIEYLWQTIFLYISLTFTSFIVEYPFYFWVLKNKNYLNVLKITLLINSLSAVLIFLYYLFGSNVLFNLP